jgi:hypothetical protein
MNTQDKTSLSLTQEVTGAGTTANALKIGDLLYRYVSAGGVFKFTVIGLRINERDTQYEVRSENCNHGWKCELLIAKNDYGLLSYVCLLNDDEEDSQKFWHNDLFGTAYHFFLTEQEAKQERIDWMINWQQKEIEKQKSSIQRAELELAKLIEMKGLSQ